MLGVQGQVDAETIQDYLDLEREIATAEQSRYMHTQHATIEEVYIQKDKAKVVAVGWGTHLNVSLTI